MFTTLAAAAALAAAGVLPAAMAAGSDTAASSHQGRVGTFMSDIPEPKTARTAADKPAEPGTPAECKELYGRPCYTARHLRHAYGVDRLNARGIQGQGETIAVVMPQKHATVQSDMNKFSDEMDLPRTKVEVIERGEVTEPDPEDPSEAGNVQEANLDLQMAHAMAPRAKLILVSTAHNWDDAKGLAPWKEISDAIDWVSRNRDVTAISMSYGIFERALADAAGTPGDYHLVNGLRRGLKTAAGRDISLFAATGNHGPTGPTLQGDGVYPDRTVPWPASDPLVTGVGATDLYLTDKGERTAPDRLWTDDAKLGGVSGSGRSLIWKGRPSADLTAVGGGSSRTWIYSSMNGLEGQKPGWTRVAGTSAASPAVAGITVLAAQQAGHRLGNVTRAVRAIRPNTRGTYDLYTGCNTAWDVEGFCAKPGMDTASGTGTINDAVRWTRALAAARR
ncbi:S8 family serine peptidase [Streptomyces nanshensis]|uniref:Peptidase S53 domain-containing protein n=1 Tax=Streptomyces nanshensis TaxID=518642 RepID=A0A1E7KZC5_9ACTN|nr:S8 family serine peptidase [Streptomyces nanshensis]OEV09286.1 hypothetical protein AN218_22845 [Streptomyces nanshensis]